MNITSTNKNDEQLQQLKEINENLSAINRKTGGNLASFWRGVLTGFGYLLGALIAVLIVGWVLNVIGIIPAFSDQVDSLREALDAARTKQVQ